MIFEIGKKSNNLETKVLYLDNWRASGNGFFSSETNSTQEVRTFICLYQQMCRDRRDYPEGININAVNIC